ncbi:MAG: hypothetical protein RI894_529 [Bacteroidota bacterium]|jgi:putative ABC transport system permease protein
MNLFYLAHKNLLSRPLSAALTVVLFALGVGLITFLFLLNHQLEKQFDRNLAGIDLVVGAKGSPMQLILSSIYHLDVPTGNIKIADAGFLMRHPSVAKTIPQALGDSYRGFRICGTNHAYVDLYHARLKEGYLWDKDFEVTIGSTVAQEASLKLGDKIVSAHGIAEEGDEHKEHQYTVMGILAPTETVLDQLVLTSVASVWAMHRHENTAEKGAELAPDSVRSADDLQREITTLLVFYKNKSSLTALNLPRLINQNTPMQAASPVMETARLYQLMGSGFQLFEWLAYLIAIVSAFSVFIALFNALRARRYELAVMRVMGASRSKLFRSIIIEGLFMALGGTIVGLGLAHFAVHSLSWLFSKTWHYGFTGKLFLPSEFVIVGVALSIGFLAAILPAIQAAKTDISTTLSSSI